MGNSKKINANWFLKSFLKASYFIIIIIFKSTTNTVTPKKNGTSFADLR